jgi:hypothetical protein
VPARWRLAAAYTLVGQTEVAKQLVNNAPTQIAAYQELAYTYGSNTRDEAMILETMTLMKMRSKAAGLAKGLAERMSSDRWMNTQTTAYSLLAMSKFIGTTSSDKTMRFSYKINSGKTISKATQIPVFKKDLRLNGKKGEISLSNTGKGMLYARVIVEGIPVAGDQSSASSHLRMNIKYLDMEGSPIDETKIEQGTDFIAEVTLTNPGTRGYLKEMTLNQIFPSGWEIHNTRMDGFTAAVKTSYFDYQDIRDDRVYTYYQLSKSKSKTYRIQLNATYMGRFYLPTVESEAMYDNTINARVPGRWVEVLPVNDGLSNN